jgi:hypothetical protein
MSEPEKVETYYQAQAKNVVDHLFDAKYFHPDITRDGMAAVEELLAFMFQTNAKSAVRCAEMSFKIKPHSNLLAKKFDEAALAEIQQNAQEEVSRA